MGAPAAARADGRAAEPPQDALTYVRAVKSRFQASKPEVYEAFLGVMRDFKNARSDTPDVVRRVKVLLGGHPDLLDGFNCFLPEPYKFNAVKDAEAEKAAKEGQPTIGGGYNLLKRIRKVYSHDERPYHAFLAILIRFRNAEFTTEQVIRNVSTLFFDEPELLHGKDGLEFFVPKNCSPPKPSPWFEWTPQTHNRFGRTSFRVAVRMLLLCEKRSRGQPPDLTKKKVRLDNGGGSGDSSEESSSEEESSDEDEDDANKDPGHVDPEKLPPIWDQRTARVFSEFEKMALELKPMSDDACWEDSLAQKEENDRNADAVARRGLTNVHPLTPPQLNPLTPTTVKTRRLHSLAVCIKGASLTTNVSPCFEHAHVYIYTYLSEVVLVDPSVDPSA